jgi:hypothetical protein
MIRKLTGGNLGKFKKKKTYLKYKISEFQWKSIHNIVNTACRLNRMGLSQVKGYCYFCKTHLATQQQRLFYSCKLTFPDIFKLNL